MLCEQIKGEAEITDNYLCTKQRIAKFSCGHKEEPFKMTEGAWAHTHSPSACSSRERPLVVRNKVRVGIRGSWNDNTD